MKPIYAKGLNHVMIDIETLDVTPDASVISIAAVPFALSAQEEIDMFFNLGQYDVPLEYHEWIELPRQIENNDTFRFHIEKETGAIENCLKNGKPLKEVLGSLHRVMTQWAPPEQEYFIWGWGYGFDLTMLTYQYRHNPDTWWKKNGWAWPDGITDYRTQTHHRKRDSNTISFVTGGPVFVSAGSHTHSLEPGATLKVDENGQAVWIDPNEDLIITTEGHTWPLPYWLSKYTRILDARSIFFGHGKTWEDMPIRKGQHHDALDDVKHQIKTIQRVFSGDDDECSDE